MGIFSKWQPLYAAHGIPTIPVDENKKPLIKQPSKIGLPASAQLGQKFTTVNNFAFLAGSHSRIAVVDVDTQDEQVWDEAIRMFGTSPLMIRTGSGNLQILYRHAGEKRHIRPQPDLPIDILGSGIVLAAPSPRGQGYEIIRGSLADLENLPPIRDLDKFLPSSKAANNHQAPGQGRIGAGNRNAALVEYLRPQAGYCESLEVLIDVAETWADDHLERTTGHAFTAAEIHRTAKSVWRWYQDMIAQGTYFAGRGGYFTVKCALQDELMSAGSDVWFLYGYLRRNRYRDPTFSVPNDMHNDLSLSLTRFKNARKALLGLGIIEERQRASSYHGVAHYAWGRK